MPKREEGPKFCPCGKAAVDMGDGKLVCPQHFTAGEDLVDGSAPFDNQDSDDVEADEGTNKGATEPAVEFLNKSAKGKELSEHPTQDAMEMSEVEAAAGNSEEATDLANARSGKDNVTATGEKTGNVEKNVGTKAADERAGISEDARKEADATESAGSTATSATVKADTEKSVDSGVTTDGAAGAGKKTKR